MTNWTESISYSLQYDSEMARISGFDDRCQEHWAMIETGKGYKQRRDETVLKIMDAIESGHLPGEVI